MLQVNHYRQAAENASSDLAAEKVKTETLTDEVCIICLVLQMI